MTFVPALGWGIRWIPSLLTLILCLAGATASAQTTLFTCDSTDDAVYKLTDLDGNGAFDPLTEVQTFYSDLSAGPDLSVPSHLLVEGNRVLLADSGTLDAIFSLEDLNADGDAEDPGEISPFYDDSSSGVNLSSPNGLAMGPGGALFVSDDGAAVRAVIRMFDANGDGDALDDGESSVFFDGSAVGLADPLTDPESITVSPQGLVYVGDTASGRVLRLTDQNGDGDALDAMEAQVFYEGANPIALEDIDSLQADSVGGLYAIDENTGVVLYLQDNNADGDALDPGEAMVFLEGATVGLTDMNDATLVADAVLWVADGGIDGIMQLSDGDGSGGVDPSEVTPIFDDGGSLFSTPSGLALRSVVPMTAPTITSLTPTSGPLAGGTAVTVSGTGLLGATDVRFGSQSSTSFQVIDEFTLEAVAPPGAQAGTVDLSVETPAGLASLIAAFEYSSPIGLIVTAVQPERGSTSGGTVVTITGSGWDPAMALEVHFGTIAATGVSVTGSTLEVVTPAHPSGLVDVEVSQGTLSAISPDDYRFQTPFLRGDLDGNGGVCIGDAVVLLNYLFVAGAPVPPCLDALDVNDDATVEIDDGLQLLQYLFGSGPAPLPPFPAEGLDPTPTNLGC